MHNLVVEKRIEHLTKSVEIEGHYGDKKTLWMARETLRRLRGGLCGRCGKRPFRDGSSTCEKCKRQQSGYSTKERRRRRKQGQCERCSSAAVVNGFCDRCYGLRNAAAKRLRDAAREEFFDHYGRRCACCGLEDERFLSVDHVNNDGHKHRREIFGGNRSGNPVYLIRWLKRHNWPDWVQVLCFNCNMGKSRNGGICPHESRK